MFVCLYSQLSATLADLHRVWSQRSGSKAERLVGLHMLHQTQWRAFFLKGAPLSLEFISFNWFSAAPLEGVLFYLWNRLPFQTLSRPICLFLHEYWVEVLYWSFVHASCSMATTEWWTVALVLAHELTSSICPTCIYVFWCLSRLYLVGLFKCNLGVFLLHRNQINSPWDSP